MARKKTAAKAKETTTKKVETVSVSTMNLTEPLANEQPVKVTELSVATSISDIDLLLLTKVETNSSNALRFGTLVNHLSSRLLSGSQEDDDGNNLSILSKSSYDDYVRMTSPSQSFTTLGANDRFGYTVSKRVNTLYSEDVTVTGTKTFQNAPRISQTITDSTPNNAAVTKKYVDDKISTIGGETTYEKLVRYDAIYPTVNGTVLGSGAFLSNSVTRFPENSHVSSFTINPNYNKGNIFYVPLKEPYTNFKKMYIVTAPQWRRAGCGEDEVDFIPFSEIDTHIFNLYVNTFATRFVNNCEAFGFSHGDETDNDCRGISIANTRHVTYKNDNIDSSMRNTTTNIAFRYERQPTHGHPVVCEVYGIDRIANAQDKWPTKHIASLSSNLRTTAPSNNNSVQLSAKNTDEYYTTSDVYQIKSSDINGINQSYTSNYNNQLMFNVFRVSNNRLSSIYIYRSFGNTEGRDAQTPYYKLRLYVQKRSSPNYGNNNLTAWDMLYELGSSSTNNPVSADVDALDGRIPPEQVNSTYGYFKIPVSQYKLEVGDKFQLVSYLKYNGENDANYKSSIVRYGYTRYRSYYYGINLLA